MPLSYTVVCIVADLSKFKEVTCDVTYTHTHFGIVYHAYAITHRHKSTYQF